jgi:hypothetical protein
MYTLIGQRVDSGMPPANAPQLSAEEKAILKSWANSGGPGSECGATPTCADDPNYCVGERFLDCTPDVRIQAHAGDKRTPYTVRAGTTDAYYCYRFANPFYAGGSHAGRLITREAPIIGNGDVIHHWLLFGTRGGFYADGMVDEQFGLCVGPELTDTLLSGWAPGGTNQVMPGDVGVTVSEFPWLTLQVHYNNPNGGNAQDASGLAWCTTPESKPNVAGIVTLGQDLGINIPGGAKDYPGGKGVCANMSRTGRSATIVTSAPHMHKLGSGFTTEHVRGGQRIGYVSNVPLGTWRFDGQVHYPHTELSPSSGGRIEVRPGDQLITTCYYTNPGILPVGFGTATNTEMCYDFVFAYPIAELRRGCGALLVSFNQ